MIEKSVQLMVKLVLMVLFVAMLLGSYYAGAYEFIMRNPSDLIELTLQHIRLVGLSALAAILIAVPLGIFVTRPRYKKYDWLVINFANIGQTVPTIAILALIMSYFGLGWHTAVLALWFNSLLPILRNTVAGIENVNPSIVDAGRGMGMTGGQILWKLELSNALPVILAGVRTAVVINVGSAALAFLIGGGGLGDFIFTGIALNDTGIMLAGAVPVIILAISLDFLLGKLEKIIVSKGIQRNVEIA